MSKQAYEDLVGDIAEGLRTSGNDCADWEYAVLIETAQHVLRYLNDHRWWIERR